MSELRQMRWHHCGLAVSDIEASAHWYHEKLGFAIDRRFLLPEAGLELVNMVNPNGARIELLQRVASVSPGYQTTQLDDLSPGSKHLCFQVDDIDRAALDLKERGIELIQEPRVIEPARVKNLWLQDLEGNRIEFVEVL